MMNTNRQARQEHRERQEISQRALGKEDMQQRVVPLCVMMMLAVMSMACWSSDTLFIPPTATVLPTDVPPTPNFSSKYALGEEVTVVTAGIAPLYITKQPEPPSRSNRVPNAACYADSVVVIEGIQQVDGVTYYQITCNNLPGWVSEEVLSAGR